MAASRREVMSFRKAKKNFQDIVEYFGECLRALRDMKYIRIRGKSLVDPDVFRGKDIDDMLQRIDSMTRDIQRAKMKIVFAGKADSCRDVIINAILGKSVIPISYETEYSSLSIGNCFVHIEGSKDYVLHVARDDGQEERLKDASDVEMVQFQPESVIKVYLPECEFLDDDLVLVDGPDLDYGSSMATAFRKQCQDCNIFVLAANSPETLDASTKEFVKTLYRRLPVRPKCTFVTFLGRIPEGKDSRHTNDADARQFLTRELRMTHGSAASSIYWFPTNEIQNIMKAGKEHDNNSFACRFNEFREFLKSQAIESTVKRTLLHPFESLNDMNKVLRNILKCALEEVQRKKQQQTQRKSIFGDIKERIIGNESILDEVRNKVTSACRQHLKHVSKVTLESSLENDHGEMGWGAKAHNQLVEELDHVKSLREVDWMFTKHTEELWRQIMLEMYKKCVCVCENGTCYSEATASHDPQTCPKIATMRDYFKEASSDQGQTMFKLNYNMAIADYSHFMSGFQEQLDNPEFCFDSQVLQFLPIADQWPNRDRIAFVEKDSRITGSVSEGNVTIGNSQGSYAICRAISSSPSLQAADGACGPGAHSDAPLGILNIFSVETRDGRILAKGAVTESRSVVFKAHRVRFERDTLFKMRFLNFVLLKLIASVDEMTERVVANFSEQLKEYCVDVIDCLEDCLQLRDNRLICEKLADMEGKLKENEECCEQTKIMLCEFFGNYLN